MEAKQREFTIEIFPQFTVKGSIKNFTAASESFTRIKSWLNGKASEGYAIHEESDLGVIQAPGFFAKFVLRRKLEFINAPTIIFKRQPNVSYDFFPVFEIKATKMKSKEKKKVSVEDQIFALLEKNRGKFEEKLNTYFKEVASKGLSYIKSFQFPVMVPSGCFRQLRGIKGDMILIDAIELRKMDKNFEYKCRVFPRLKVKKSRFNYEELTTHLQDQIESEEKEGYSFAGNFAVWGIMKSGCLGMSTREIGFDAFLFKR